MNMIKKKYALCKLCGINLLTVILGAAAVVYLSKIMGMGILLINEDAFEPWALYGMELLYFYWLFWIMFEFYRQHIAAVKVLPYRKQELFGMWINVLKILTVFRVIFQAIGMREEMEYCFSPYLIYGKSISEVALQCAGGGIFILLNAGIDMIVLSLLIYKLMNFVENNRSNRAFYIYVGIQAVLCIILGIVKAAAIRFIPMTWSTVITCAVLFAALLIVSDIIISKLMLRCKSS